MTIAQIVQSHQQQRIGELAQKQQVKQIAFNHMKNGCGVSDGENISKVIRDYAMSLAPEKRLSASWILNEIFHSEATRLGEYVHQQNPSWV